MLTLGISAPYFLSFPVEALSPPGSLLTHSIALAHGLFHLSEIHHSLSFSRKFQSEHKWVSCFVSSSRSYQARDLSTISCVEQQSCLGCTKKSAQLGRGLGRRVTLSRRGSAFGSSAAKYKPGTATSVVIPVTG